LGGSDFQLVAMLKPEDWQQLADQFTRQQDKQMKQQVAILSCINFELYKNQEV